MTQKNFNKTGDQSFAVAGNWSPNGVPGEADDVAIDSGAVVSSVSDEEVDSVALGSNNFLDIAGGSFFTVEAGTFLNANYGTISISGDSVFDLTDQSTEFDNPGAITLNGADLFITSTSTTLYGGGTLEMAIGGGLNTLASGATNLSSPIYRFGNVDNTISGDGVLGAGLNFTNGGTIETNNATSSSGGTLQITTDLAVIGGVLTGYFSNVGIVRADDGGALIFGQDQTAQIFSNYSNIDAESSGDPTKLEIAGNVTIEAISSSGNINLGGSGAQAGDKIVSDGQTATLTLINQTLKGAGTIGDDNLTIDNVSGTIAANLRGETLSLGVSGGPIFTNGGTLEAVAGGILNAANSPIANSGTISALNGGIVDLGSVLSIGAVDIGTGGTMTVVTSLSGNVTFTGGNAELAIDNPGNGDIIGEIVGAAATDSIDLTSSAAPYSASNHLSWQQTSAGGGVLSLVNSANQTIEALSLAGTFATANFTMASDGNQGTLIEIGNLPPPAATTADMIMDDTGGDYEIYDLGNNAILAAYALDQISTSWQVAGLGGFAGTDTSDMMLRNPSNGQLEIYDVGNNNISGPFSIGQVGTPWVVAGFADFSGHANETDMLMQNSSTGQFEVYDISNNQLTNAVSMGQVGAPWVVAGFGDFSGHAGETGDMLMRNATTGAFEVYDINNNQITSSVGMGQVGLEWSVAGFGDFSGNANETDMLMRNDNTGAFEIYDITNNAIYNSAAMGQVGLEWQVAGFGPINGAGSSDMLMRNTSTGAFEVYDIANNQLTTAASLGQVGPAWSVAGVAADPPPAAPSQLLQAMASFAPSSASGVSAPLQLPPGELTTPTVLTAPQA